MGKTREIKKRIKAVGNIRRITKTMQMIATSKFARANQQATANKPYTAGIFELVTELAGTAGDVSHPLITGPADGKGKPELTLVLTSDRGLCGPYNSSILRLAMNHFKGDVKFRPPAGKVELVGKKGAGFFRYNNVSVEVQHTQFGDKPTFEKVEALAQNYMDRFIKGEISGVTVVYMKYLSAGRQTPEAMRLLPLKPPAKAGGPAAGEKKAVVQYEFSPAAPELLGDLLPATVKATLFQCFLDAVVSEHMARQVAMKAATENAGKMRKLFTRDYNRARQAQITTELSEIIGGAAALA
ncbi:MAG: ATP synthase F1 subunit gamma [Planctomycetaceae bacterium]|jgi:F-type H+-transporting ATPase subunit gamma|nr:ATP synthase F1 subunit gamma [Phycisphaerales bacterium]MCE2653657.1 ATP synthase F1 subunit gamma [Planctomycetaceae bacterium]